MADFQEEIAQIQERNKRVEMDKAWETSWTRRLFIAVVTYGLATLWLALIDANDPMLNALVPVGGYLLSTLTLPFLKAWWVKRITL